MPRGPHAPCLELDRHIPVFAHRRRAMIRRDEERRQLTMLPHARDKCTEGVVDGAVSRHHGPMLRISQVRDTIDAGEYYEQQSPRFSGRRNPGLCDRAIERPITAEVVCRGAKKRALQWNAMRARPQAARNRRADRDTLGDQIEQRWSGGDVAVDPARLDATIAAHGAPLRSPTARRLCSLKPATARDPHMAGKPSEQEWDIRDAGGGGKNGRSDPEASPRREDPASQVREIAAID